MDELAIVLSDIHSNREALRACLDDIKRRFGGKHKLYFLGDAVGYGPNPKEVLDDLIKLEEDGQLALAILGNHDEAAIFDPDSFNGAALDAIMWTRGVLEKSGRRMDAYFEFLSGMKRRAKLLGVEFVHGSVRGPQSEYVKPEDIYDEAKMGKIRDKMEGIVFCGHTHLPGVFDLSGTQPTFQEPSGYDPDTLMSNVVLLEKGRKQIVNVGAVGQPRDDDNRACYAVFNPTALEVAWVRVPYDYGKTMKTMEGIPELQPSLRERLRLGR